MWVDSAGHRNFLLHNRRRYMLAFTQGRQIFTSMLDLLRNTGLHATFLTKYYHIHTKKSVVFSPISCSENHKSLVVKMIKNSKMSFLELKAHVFYLKGIEKGIRKKKRLRLYGIAAGQKLNFNVSIESFLSNISDSFGCQEEKYLSG